MNKEFYIAISIKKFINNLDEMIINIPNKERYLKYKIKKDAFNLLENVYLANYNDLVNRKEHQKVILTKISMLDYYLEYLYRKKYISHKMCENKCDYLLEIKKMIYKWIKTNEKC